MSVPNIITELRDEDNNLITNMNASWISKAYPLGSNVNTSFQFRWSDETLTGVLYMDYTCAPITKMDEIVEEDWIQFAAANLVGDKDGALFLDANLAISAFRFRFEHLTGTADLIKVFLIGKRNY